MQRWKYEDRPSKEAPKDGEPIRKKKKLLSESRHCATGNLFCAGKLRITSQKISIRMEIGILFHPFFTLAKVLHLPVPGIEVPVLHVTRRPGLEEFPTITRMRF